MRDGLRRFLETVGPYKIVADVGDGHEAVSMTDMHRPDIVIMDLAMPRLNGIEATRQIFANGIPTLIIILSMHAGHADVARAMKVGASGYIHKSKVGAEIVTAIKTVLAGGCYLSPALANEHENGISRTKAPLDSPRTENPSGD